MAVLSTYFFSLLSRRNVIRGIKIPRWKREKKTFECETFFARKESRIRFPRVVFQGRGKVSRETFLPFFRNFSKFHFPTMDGWEISTRALECETARSRPAFVFIFSPLRVIVVDAASQWFRPGWIQPVIPCLLVNFYQHHRFLSSPCWNCSRKHSPNSVTEMKIDTPK